MRNPRILTTYAHRCLKNMYLTLFWAMLSSTVGSFFHLIWDIGGLFTVLTAAWTILFLLTPSPLEVRMRLLWLMTAAFFIGASVGLLTKYLFGIDQGNGEIIILLAARIIEKILIQGLVRFFYLNVLELDEKT